MNIPHEVQQILSIIEKYKPLLVGGCVRDSLIGHEPNDFDIVVEKITAELLNDITDSGWSYSETGKDINIYNVFKKIPVTIIDEFGIEYVHEEYFSVELLEYLQLNEDAGRRDFTINALYYDPFECKIIDPTGRGVQDINDRVVRMIKKSSIDNDSLRILRGYRLVKQLNFKFDPATLTYCRRMFEIMIRDVSYSRIMSEIEKLCICESSRTQS